jgi:hypothetical protein
LGEECSGEDEGEGAGESDGGGEHVGGEHIDGNFDNALVNGLKQISDGSVVEEIFFGQTMLEDVGV